MRVRLALTARSISVIGTGNPWSLSMRTTCSAWSRGGKAVLMK
jgi:hypothetical protein